MIILKKDFKQGKVSLKLSSPDDLWYLSHLISPTDHIIMKTERKIKINAGEDTNHKVTRKIVVLTLEAETITYDPSLHQLRVKGKIFAGPDDVPKGTYHTFGIEKDSSLTIIKKEWPHYLQNKLTEASQNKGNEILVVVFDREKALFSSIKQSGITHLSKLEADVAKKDMESTTGESIYDLIAKSLKEYEKTITPSNIILASPSFWRKYMEKKLPDELRKKSVFATCSEVHKRVIGELVLRPELKTILSSQRSRMEMAFVELMLEKLQKELVVYGLADVIEAANSGAISEIGVTDKFIEKSRDENKYEEVDLILKNVDSSKGKVHFINSEEAAKRIDGLGGIIGILRWNLN